MDTNKETARGSAKMFAIKGHDAAALVEALGLARELYEVKWWWKYGQPAIDRIQAQLDVPKAQLGKAITQLMEMNGPELQVNVTCFPNGIPKPDVFRVDASFQKAV
jgi:hypothetical protein